jgi:GDSL-like lipase/acylhydrolase family protein
MLPAGREVRNGEPRERTLRAALCAGAILLTLLALDAALGVVSAAHFLPVHLSNRRVSVALDCYPSNPRGYFDVDLRDAERRSRYDGWHVRGVDEAWSRAPFAVELRFNSLQFRDAEFGPRRPGVRRVAVLGDSFTEGQGVKEADTYPRRLETLLNAAGDGQWEVLNWGRRGADFPRLYDTFEQILEYDPDLVVYGMFLNDAEQSQAFRARYSFVNEWMAGRRRPRLEPALIDFVFERLERRRLGRETLAWYAQMYGEPNREGWERTQGHLRDMDRRMRERGGRLLVADWPVLLADDSGRPLAPAHRAIAAACAAMGIAHHDLRAALSGRPAESLWVHPLDQHPNDVAHRLAAESLAPAVRALAKATSS